MSQSTSLDNRPQRVLQGYLDALLLDVLLEPPAPTVTAVEVKVETEMPVAVAATSVSEDEFAAAVREERARDAERQQMKIVSLAPRLSVSAAVQPDIEAPPPVADPDIELDWRVPGLSAAGTSSALAPPGAPGLVGIELGRPATATAASGGGQYQPPAYDGQPAWSEAPFECLLFDVAGLTLAAPLICLGSIYPLTDEQLTPLFGQPDWFLGLLPCQAGNLRVLDTARWVMPERYRDDYREGLKFVISLEGQDWGLAVHGVSHSVRLDPAEVKWRPQRANKPWLAGTVIDQMCALLDMAALVEQVVGQRVD